MNHELSQAHWFKSTHSKETTACVEIAHLDTNRVGIRDSKNPTGPALIFTPEHWDAFNTNIQNGNFDNA